MPISKDKENERGIALISVLWALLVLSILVLSVMTVVKVQSHYADNIGQKSKAVAIADAAIYMAIQRLSEPGAAREIPGKVTSLKLTFGDKDIDITIIPEDGKVDLNVSHEVLISAVLAYNGVDGNAADVIAEEIRNLREDNSEKTFKIISGIMRFEGVSSQLYNCIEHYLTVYSNRIGVNYAAATNDMQDVIKWADKARWGGQNWLEISGNAAGGLVSGTRSVLQQTGSHAGKAFTIQAKVALNEDVKIIRSAVIRITGDRRAPFWIYKWTENYSNNENYCEVINKK